MLWLEIKPGNLKKITLGIVYKPPDGNAEEFLLDFKEALDSLGNITDREVHILGDFNLDITPGITSKGKDLLAMTKIMGLQQYITSPTRITPNRKSILDLYFTNCSHVDDSGLTKTNLSDHNQIFLIKKKTPRQVKKATFKGRIYKNYDPLKFTQKLKQRDWNEVLEQDNPELAWESLFSQLHTTLNETCPIRDIKINRVKEEWMGNELLEQIQLKDDLLVRSRETGVLEDWIIAQKSKNQTKKMMKQAKSTYLTNALNAHQKDSKQFWRTLNKILPKKGSSGNPIKLIKEDGTPENPSDAAGIINDFFTNIASKLDKHDDPWVDKGPKTEARFDLKLISMQEIKKVIKDINILKSSGFDHISAKVLKDAFLAIPNVLLHIMNASIASSSFPISWKNATIIPIEKKPNAPTPSDFRPISLLPLPGKLLERLVSNRMMNYLEDNKLISEGQDGYRKNRSTIKAISGLTDDVLDQAGEGKITAAVFIDFSKAFDCVNHNILLKKLANLGFSRSAVKWYQSYLTNRQQRTLANGILSKYQRVTCGVPQGSILGPPLFILFVDDMTEVVKFSRTSQYADDTVVYLSSTNWQDISCKLNQDLDNLSQWCKLNKLHVNCKKTKYMVMGSRHRTSLCGDLNLKIDNNKLDKVDTFKYLGVTLDPGLNYEAHLKSLNATVRHKLFLLRTVRPFLTNFAALQTYRVMILPLLEYGNTLYDSAPKKHLNKLQVAQNSALKAVFGLPKLTPTALLHTKAKLGTLLERRHRAILIQAYRRSKIPKYCDDRALATRMHRATTLKVPKSKTVMAQKSLAFRGAVLWNKLPTVLREAPDLQIFKRNLDRHLARVPDQY